MSASGKSCRLTYHSGTVAKSQVCSFSAARDQERDDAQSRDTVLTEVTKDCRVPLGRLRLAPGFVSATVTLSEKATESRFDVS